MSCSQTSHGKRDEGGDLTLDTIGELLCGGIVCHGCVFRPLLSVSLFCPEGCGVFKGPKGNVKLECSGGLDYLVGGEEPCVYPALLTPGSVDGYCRMDNVDIEHVRGGRLELDLACTTCTSMTMRGRQHRRQDDRETAGAGGEVCADLTGRLPMAYNVSEFFVGRTAQNDTFRLRQSIGEQTQRDDQRCDGRHALVVARCLAVPQ